MPLRASDADLAYAKRLKSGGVPCEVNVVPGAFHAFDVVFRAAGVSKGFWQDQVRALRTALFGAPAAAAASGESPMAPTH